MNTKSHAVMRSVKGVAVITLLVFSALFYLQFGLQALFQSLTQGLLALVGAFALGWGAIRRLRQNSASPTVFIGTVPLLCFHAIITLVEPGELPFLIGSIPVPLIAGSAWLIVSRMKPVPGAI